MVESTSAAPASRIPIRKGGVWPLSVALALGAFGLLLLFFSPPWLEFLAWADVPEFARWAASVRRGAVVVAQVANPMAPVEDALHAILQYRVLFPGLGNVLQLPPVVVLALAPIGALVVLAIGAAFALGKGLPGAPGADAKRFGPAETFAALVVWGGSSWFITSTGWLGYYDAWVLLGLLVVAYSGRQWAIGLACGLTPWIDERFFLGFPLALGCRWILAGGTQGPGMVALLRSLRWPLVIVGVQFTIRFALVGFQGSPALGHYLQSNGVVAYLAAGNVPPTEVVARIALGLWEGLRAGWYVVVLGLADLARLRGRDAVVLVALLVATAAVALASANDLSRSMLLLSVAVPACWAAARHGLNARGGVGRLTLVAVAVLVPTRQVVTDVTAPVSPLWHEWARLKEEDAATYGQFYAGMSYLFGVGLPLDPARGVEWLQRAAERDHDGAQVELGGLLLEGARVPGDPVRARHWLERAATRHNPAALYLLGTAHHLGLGGPADATRAREYFRRAAVQGHALAQYNLGALYLQGQGGEQDAVTAVAWLRLAARSGDPEATALAAQVEGQLNPAQRAAVSVQVESLQRSIRESRRRP